MGTDMQVDIDYDGEAHVITTATNESAPRSTLELPPLLQFLEVCIRCSLELGHMQGGFRSTAPGTLQPGVSCSRASAEKQDCVRREGRSLCGTR